MRRFKNWVKDWINVITLIVLAISVLVSYSSFKATIESSDRSFNAAREQFEKDMRPWVNVMEIGTGINEDASRLSIKPVIKNVGKSPAFMSFKANIQIGDLTVESPPEKRIKVTIMPGQIFRTEIAVEDEGYPAVMSGKTKLIMRFHINYSLSKDSLDQYQSTGVWEFKRSKLPEKISECGKIECSAGWIMIDADMS